MPLKMIADRIGWEGTVRPTRHMETGWLVSLGTQIRSWMLFFLWTTGWVMVSRHE